MQFEQELCNRRIRGKGIIRQYLFQGITLQHSLLSVLKLKLQAVQFTSPFLKCCKVYYNCQQTRNCSPRTVHSLALLVSQQSFVEKHSYSKPTLDYNFFRQTVAQTPQANRSFPYNCYSFTNESFGCFPREPFDGGEWCIPSQQQLSVVHNSNSP